MSNTEFDDTFTAKFYKMDRATDDIVPNGRHLLDGMNVLIENPAEKFDLNWANVVPKFAYGIGDENLHWVERANRWCVVSDVEFVGDHVTFIGTYEDGTRAPRNYHVSTAWFVKKDTLPEAVFEAETNRLIAQ